MDRRFIEAAHDLVEEAVLSEFERISERGGVLGAMEFGYQRGKIQDESMLYEQRKHDGSLPIIGVNTFRNPLGSDVPETLEPYRFALGPAALPRYAANSLLVAAATTLATVGFAAAAAYALVRLRGRWRA